MVGSIGFSSKLVLLLFVMIATTDRVLGFCDSIESTWESLTGWVQRTQPLGFGIVCPFEISGKGCPTTATIAKLVFQQQSSNSLYLICASFLGGSNAECRIDCPNVQLEVAEHTHLSLEGWTIQSIANGSAAIVVKPLGRLAVFGGKFVGNINANGNGGAILGEAHSTVVVQSSVFQRNSAKNGGAIYSQGSLQVIHADFAQNEAYIKGGAVFVGESGWSQVDLTKMEGNVASLGPAVYQQRGSTVVAVNSEGCNNKELGTGSFCDGVAIGTSCKTFEGRCVPTHQHRVPYPSIAPSQEPVTHIVLEADTVNTDNIPSQSGEPLNNVEGSSSPDPDVLRPALNNPVSNSDPTHHPAGFESIYPTISPTFLSEQPSVDSDHSQQQRSHIPIVAVPEEPTSKPMHPPPSFPNTLLPSSQPSLRKSPQPSLIASSSALSDSNNLITVGTTSTTTLENQQSQDIFQPRESSNQPSGDPEIDFVSTTFSPSTTPPEQPSVPSQQPTRSTSRSTFTNRPSLRPTGTPTQLPTRMPMLQQPTGRSSHRSSASSSMKSMKGKR